MQPWKVIQELEADNSRLKKEAIIKRESDADNIRFFNGIGAVSYTHLTLPTIYSV